MPFDMNIAETGKTTSETLARPAILIRAAQFGARAYRRTRDLPSAVPGLVTQPVAAIVSKLAEVEAQLEAQRIARSAAYRPGRHVQVLAAYLAEAAA